MTGPKGKVVILLLLALCLLHEATADTLSSDEDHFLAFLNSVLPNHTSLFNSSVPTCQWPGLTCIGLGIHQRIRHLRLSWRGLNGTIPPGTLGALTSLETLNLSNNSLTGDIPSDIFNLSSLAFLVLANNRLTGSLPNSAGQLVQLRRLDISNNLLSGPLPLTFGNLRSLKFLDLHGNNFSGGLPALPTYNYLQTLDLSSNQFTGVIPSQTFGVYHLSSLNLSRNNLSGQIPGELNNLGALRTIDLSWNSFYGPLPSFSNVQQLRTLYITSNSLTGFMPSSIANLPYLRVLAMANNKFTGPLPPTPWGNGNGKLRTLDCANNSLNGSIPEGLLTYTNLSVVRLGNNDFTGPIPGNVTANAQELDFHMNQFSGNIPATLAALPTLQKLDLSSNHFNGSIPWILTELRSLQYLALADNMFAGGLFPNLSSMVNLMYLNLSSSNIGGPISDSIGTLTSLVQLDLSHNHFTGTIPNALSRTTNLTYLDLSWNNLTGEIPPGLVSLTLLNHLNISYNQLQGSVPYSNQWDTFNTSSFEGNPLLCGIALNRTCAIGESPAPAMNTPVIAPPSKHERSGSRLRVGAVIGIVAGCLIAFCAVVTALLFLCTRWTKKLPAKEVSKYLSGPVSFEADPSSWAVHVRDPGLIPVIMFEKPLLNLTFADLLQATTIFHKDTQIADGGYGPVYKGLLRGGFQIVVKVLFEGGPANEYEKAAQLEALGRIKHPNLVSLVGYCLVGEERLLVYEYMENGDLHRRLHELPEGTHNPDDWTKDTWEHPDGEIIGGDELSWPVRHKIALGIARALAFLHHGCSPHVVHRDVKASNILLDSHFEAHLADCGLAGLVDSGKRSETPVIGGTLGYVPPEYGQMWKATTRGDVYSFGVVLLELVTGKRPTGHYFHDSYGGNLVGWVRALIREKRGYKCLDPKLLSTGVESEMLEILRIGYLCTAELPSKRPTMQQIVGLLKDIQPDNS